MEITLKMRFAVPSAQYPCAGPCPKLIPAEELRWVEGIDCVDVFENDYVDGYYCSLCLYMFDRWTSVRSKGPLLSEVLPEYPFTEKASAAATIERLEQWQEEHPEAAAHPVWREINRHSMTDEGYRALYEGDPVPEEGEA